MDWLHSLPEFADVSAVVVVDGGGTRSRAAVATAGGDLLGYAEGGPTNSRSVGDEEAAANVRDVIAEAVRSEDGRSSVAAGVVTAVLVSSASVDTQAHADILTGGVREAVGDAATISVVADTIGCWAATAKLDPAVAVIAGTGSSVLAGSLEAGSRRYGGWDYVLGDEGSGFAIGKAAIRETLWVAEGRSDARALAAAVEAALEVDETDEIFDAVYKPEVDKAKVAALAGEVFRLAGEDDVDATRIVAIQATLLADSVSAAFRDYQDIATLGCFGGIWNDPGYRSAFESALGDRVPSLPHIVRPGDTAMAGSFRIVLRFHGDRVIDAEEEAAIERFESELLAAKEAWDEADAGGSSS